MARKVDGQWELTPHVHELLVEQAALDSEDADLTGSALNSIDHDPYLLRTIFIAAGWEEENEPDVFEFSCNVLKVLGLGDHKQRMECVLRKFRGSFEELQELVAITGIDGEWIERQQLKQYRADSGAILNFWESTGTVNFQGPEQAAQELEAAVFRSDGKNTKASRSQPNASSAVVDGAALRSLTSRIIRKRVGPVFDAESAQIRKIAQQCMLDLCERLGLVVQAARHDCGCRHVSGLGVGPTKTFS